MDLNFLSHMNRINKEGGYQLTVYHSFHAEVEHFRQHHWRCQGKCGQIVKRATNRAPSKHDYWWDSHQKSCGGSWEKIREPEKKHQEKNRKRKRDEIESRETISLFSYFNTSKLKASKINITTDSASSAKKAVLNEQVEDLDKQLKIPVVSNSIHKNTQHKSVHKNSNHNLIFVNVSDDFANDDAESKSTDEIFILPKRRKSTQLQDDTNTNEVFNPTKNIIDLTY